MQFTGKFTKALAQRYARPKRPYELLKNGMLCLVKMWGKGKERQRKVPARLPDHPSILICLGIKEMPSFRILSHRFAGFGFCNKTMILNEATADTNHHCWAGLKFRKGKFVVPQLWSHRRQLAVSTRTGATPVHAGAESKTQVLYLCKFHRNLPTIMKGFQSPTNRRQKKCPQSPEVSQRFGVSGKLV